MHVYMNSILEQTAIEKIPNTVNRRQGMMSKEVELLIFNFFLSNYFEQLFSIKKYD